MTSENVHVREHGANLNENNNNSCDLMSSQEGVDQQHVSSKIMYTKEFLILLKKRSQSLSYPRSLSKYCTKYLQLYLPKNSFRYFKNFSLLKKSVNGFWDPEKYFDLIKLLKKQNEEEEKQIKVINDDENSNFTEDSSLSSGVKSVTSETFDGSSINQIDSKFQIKFEAGEFYEVMFCALNLQNDFYVNPVEYLSALHELTISINKYCDKQQQTHKKESEETNFNVNLGDIVLAKSIIDGIWYRARLLAKKDSCFTLFGIDMGQTFDTISALLLPCPKDIQEIPSFALNICLTGVKLNESNAKVLNDLLKKQMSFKIKILFSSSCKYYVELFDTNGASLNANLNTNKN